MNSFGVMNGPKGAPRLVLLPSNQFGPYRGNLWEGSTRSMIATSCGCSVRVGHTSLASSCIVNISTYIQENRR